MTRLLAGVAILILLAACGSPAPTPGSTPAPSPAPSLSPTPTAVPSPRITCAADPSVPYNETDLCVSEIAAFRAAAAPAGLPIARISIEPYGFPCGVIWVGIGSPPLCREPAGLPGTAVHGWVAFFGTDKVMAIRLSRPNTDLFGSNAAPPLWLPKVVAFEMPPAGWVMPGSAAACAPTRRASRAALVSAWPGAANAHRPERPAGSALTTRPIGLQPTGSLRRQHVHFADTPS